MPQATGSVFRFFLVGSEAFSRRVFWGAWGPLGRFGFMGFRFADVLGCFGMFRGARHVVGCRGLVFFLGGVLGLCG